jgi:hypothetical protein
LGGNCFFVWVARTVSQNSFVIGFPIGFVDGFPIGSLVGSPNSSVIGFQDGLPNDFLDGFLIGFVIGSLGSSQCISPGIFPPIGKSIGGTHTGVLYPTYLPPFTHTFYTHYHM